MRRGNYGALKLFMRRSATQQKGLLRFVCVFCNKTRVKNKRNNIFLKTILINNILQRKTSTFYTQFIYNNYRLTFDILNYTVAVQ